jgi:L-cysteine/cystine lyase
MDLDELRGELPVLARVAYLNAGTDGPVPRRALRAAAERAEVELERGRSGGAHHGALAALSEAIRDRLASLLACDRGEVALTRSTTDGVTRVLSALELRRGDDLLTSDEEHPGLLAPLAVAARRSGARLRVAPFATLAAEAGPRTRLVACSHVSWVTGATVDARALAETEAPVLLDGAQGLGAVPAGVGELGYDFYAASGQKWLCGPDGTGALYVRGELIPDLVPAVTGYASLADPRRAAELALHPDARRFDAGSISGPAMAWWLAAIDLLGDAGWEAVHERAADLADTLAGRLAERGLDVSPRGRSTLVSWRDPEPAAAVERLRANGIVVRDLPGRGLMRASVGAWNTAEEVERLIVDVR